MNRALFILLLSIPSLIFCVEEDKGVLQINTVIKVVSSASEVLWSETITKYTINNRSISINLKGFDGDLYATLTPVVLKNNFLLLKTTCVVKSLETDSIIMDSENDVVVNFDEIITFYPIGNKENAPNIIMELSIKKLNGDNS